MLEATLFSIGFWLKQKNTLTHFLNSKLLKMQRLFLLLANMFRPEMLRKLFNFWDLQWILAHLIIPSHRYKTFTLCSLLPVPSPIKGSPQQSFNPLYHCCWLTWPSSVDIKYCSEGSEGSATTKLNINLVFKLALWRHTFLHSFWEHLLTGIITWVGGGGGGGRWVGAGGRLCGYTGL